MLFRKILSFAGFCMYAFSGYGQVVTECPQNIGFERGNFENWQCYIGEISPTNPRNYPNAVRPAFVTVYPTSPMANRHTLIGRGNTDPYGGFSLNSPNGSDYVVKLGNNSGGHEAEAISYTLEVPDNAESYSVTFNYAVVFENPDHAYDEQPKFTAKVIDLTAGTSTSCGSFEFVASGGLPGFTEASGYSNVLVKPWSPVMVNLSDYKGHTIRLEFTTNDCSHERHFGYAYIDFNENCSIPITGNITCPEVSAVTLRTLPGFAGYRWFMGEDAEPMGNSETLTLSPVPAIGTKISVEVTPYAGLGCSQVLSTVITGMYMNLGNPPESCRSVDITATALTVGNSSDLVYTYWKNSSATVPLADPKHVTVGGTYYVKGSSSSGCSQVLPINVTITKLAPIIVTPPEPRIYPARADITTTYEPESGLVYTYWRDQHATVPLADPKAVKLRGTYYIKATNSEGCSIVAPVFVDIIVEGIIIPNTFTPNGDGVNDVFTILMSSSITVRRLKIFNRWGEAVYETNDITRYWNGLRSDKPVPVGVYYYLLEGDQANQYFKRSGSITVLR